MFWGRAAARSENGDSRRPVASRPAAAAFRVKELQSAYTQAVRHEGHFLANTVQPRSNRQRYDGCEWH